MGLVKERLVLNLLGKEIGQSQLTIDSSRLIHKYLMINNQSVRATVFCNSLNYVYIVLFVFMRLTHYLLR